MSKSQEQLNIERWKDDPRAKGAKWVLDVCDTFDYNHYPVFVKTEKELKKAKIKYNQNMQQIFSITKLK